MSSKSPRLDSLTSLRYLAAVAVVITHANPYFITSHLLRASMAYWYVGVSFFYLLSGFVLTWSCLHQQAGRFWWNRFARIWPLQATMMIAAYVFFWDIVRHPPTALGWLLQPFLLQAWDPDSAVYAGGNGPTWSLSCEVFFYLMFPLLVRWVRRMRGRDLAVAAAVLIAVLAVAPALARPYLSARDFEWAFFYLPGYRIGEFFIGMLLARVVMLGLRFRRPAFWYLLGWAGLAAWSAVVTWYDLSHGREMARPFATLLALPSFSLLVLTAASADLTGSARLLRARFAVRLGEWSFAVYLVHDLILEDITHRVWLGNQGGMTGFGYLLVFITVCTLAAAVAHYAVEKPAERWLRKHLPAMSRAARGPGARRADDTAARVRRLRPGRPRLRPATGTEEPGSSGA